MKSVVASATVAFAALLFAVNSSATAENIDFMLVSHCSGCAGNGCAGNGCDGACNGCAGGDSCAGGSSCTSGCCSLAGGVCGCGCGPLQRLFGGGDNSPWNIGGWLETGYYTEGNGLFNNHPDDINMDQAWLYVEREADTSNGIGLGMRMDLTYGRDAPDTQAFGGTGWDTTWNRGAGYGWAMPQLYAEIATENVSTIIGHFFTIVGYEVVTAPDNFFYSHAMTMYNSEPFTHTGVLSTFTLSDDLTAYAGWTAGWDTGFESTLSGSNFLGGLSANLLDDLTFTYILTAGNFGLRSQGFNGYSHSLVFDATLTERLNYVLQSDYLRVDGTGEDNIGINQYLFYTLNNCWALGTRIEWWQADAVTDYTYGGRSANPVDATSYYEATFGVNWRPSERMVFRPEYRYEWSPALDYEQGIFGIDWITLF